jgi:hypothetical protein
MYGAAKNTWAFPPAKPGNSTKTQSDAAASRHLSLGIAVIDEPGPLPATPRFYIRQLTDVSRCKLQQYLSRK